MHLFEIHPRSTGDGENLSGDTLGGTAKFRWFRSVRSEAEYARHRAGMLVEDSTLIVHRTDGATEEGVMPGSGKAGIVMNTAPALWF